MGKKKQIKGHRSEVGPGGMYDVIGAQQFCIVFGLGLREHHKLLDFGCGSLRGGRLFIAYLLPGNYYGVEPQEWLVQKGIEEELGESVITLKKPKFYHFDDFKIVTHIRQKFDYILMQSILSHCGSDLVDLLVGQAARALVPGGKFACTFFIGGSSGPSGWLGHGVSTHRMEYMAAVGKRHGLAMKDLKMHQRPGPHQLKHPAGQRWICYVKPG